MGRTTSAPTTASAMNLRASFMTRMLLFSLPLEKAPAAAST
jgi:hypothetical protein